MDSDANTIDEENNEENEFKDQIMVNTVLAFTAYGLDTGTDLNVSRILGETFRPEEIDAARDLLWDRCHDGYLPEKRNRHNTDKRTGKQAKIEDIVVWVTTLTQLMKRPQFVVDVEGLARMPKFQIESISDVALSDRMVKLESRVSGINSTVLQHILDVEAEVTALRKSLTSMKVRERSPSRDIPCRIQSCAPVASASKRVPPSPPAADSSINRGMSIEQTRSGNAQAHTDASTSGEMSPASQPDNNSLEINTPVLDPSRSNRSSSTLSHSHVDQTQSSQRVSVTQSVTRDNTMKSTVLTDNTITGDDGKTYNLPLRVNLDDSRSRASIKVSRSTQPEAHALIPEGSSPSSNPTLESYVDVVKKGAKRRIVFGNSDNSVIKAAPEVLFHAAITGVDCSLKEDDLKSFLKGKHIVFRDVKCYSKEQSLSKTFKVTLPPSHYRRLQNPNLWGTGIVVKRFFDRNTN